jgi:hypothetical protein
MSAGNIYECQSKHGVDVQYMSCVTIFSPKKYIRTSIIINIREALLTLSLSVFD